ncbi:MAG: hypothetical protein R2939_19330 [Kofleriaceae bacterium]
MLAPLGGAALAEQVGAALPGAIAWSTRRRLGARGADVPVVEIQLLAASAHLEQGVPLGRGRARVTLRRGTVPVFAREVRTDTLVGRRGDDVGALAPAMARQLALILAPHVRAAFEGRAR